MTLEERARAIAANCSLAINEDALAEAILSALQYAQAEAYAKAAKRVEQLSYDIRNLVMGEKP